MPEAGPAGMEAMAGGLFGAMVTVTEIEYAEAKPLLSLALALTRYEPGVLHLWEAVAGVPESTSAVVVVVPSPQLKVYLTWFPSGSAAEVE